MPSKAYFKVCFEVQNLVAIFSCQSILLGTNVPNDRERSYCKLIKIKKHTANRESSKNGEYIVNTRSQPACI